MTAFSCILRLDMISDWRIGTGTGRQGSVDSLVVRDIYGLPYVPAKTLRGIWRDAAEQLAFGLDKGEAHGPWSAVVDHVFGSQPALGQGGAEGPIAGVLSIGDARFPNELGTHLEDRPAVRAAFTFVKSGVKIDPFTGRAEESLLKFDEIARAGALLDCPIEFRSSGDGADDMLLRHFALAALRLIDRLGGDRRRGAGRCKIDVVDKARAIEDAIDWLRRNADGDPTIGRSWATAARVSDPAATVYQNAGQGRGGVVRVGLQVSITEPTTIAEKVEANVVSTLDHIPGTLLVPAAASLLAKAGIGPADFGPAFSAGRIRILPAYPGIDGQRALPAPMTIEEMKDNRDGPAQDGKRRRRGLMRPRRNTGNAGSDTKQYKPLRSDYALPSLDNGLRLAERPITGLRTHNAVDDRRQKPTEDAGGGVYVNEAMKSGTVLYGEIVVDASLVPPGTLERKLAKATVPARLGRAKTAGYGGAAVSVTSVTPSAAGSGAASPQPKVLWLTSDLILPIGAAGRPVDALADLLRDIGLVGTIDPMLSDLRFRRVDGWIGAWGLPRPTLTAISAGSVIAFSSIEALADDAVQRLHHAGLGMRRGEGYGDVLVDPAILTADEKFLNPTGDPATAPHSAEPPLTGVGFDKAPHLAAFLSHVEKIAVLGLVRTCAELAAADPEIRRTELCWQCDGKPVPPMSQLGTIRSLIDATAETPDFSAARSFIGKIRTAEKRASKWGGDAALARLDRLLLSPRERQAEIWRIIGRLRLPDFNFATELERTLIRSSSRQVLEQFGARATADFLLAAIRQHKRTTEPQEPARQEANHGA